MTSWPPWLQDGSSRVVQLCLLAWALPMNPSMRPLSTSAMAEAAWCGPPTFTGFGSWNGATQVFVCGSGEHTDGLPSFIGMPSEPGYVPKYESKERFSCITMTTCLIRWRAISRIVVPPYGVGAAVPAGVG